MSSRPAGPRYQGFAEAQLPLGRRRPAARALPAPAAATRQHPLGAALGQVFDTYILAVADDGSLVLVDQHAAHERLTHEALRAQHAAGGVRGQPLLLPAVVDLPPADAARLLARGGRCAALGLELEAFGAGAVLVRALPACLGAPDPAPLLRDLADELAESGETTALHARLDAVLARLACHGSIRAGRRLQRGGDGRAAAADGGDPARRHLQPRPPDRAEADPGRDRAAVRPALKRCRPDPVRTMAVVAPSGPRTMSRRHG